MKLILDYLKLTTQCILRYAADSPGAFSLIVALAVILAAACWVVCSKWTYLWNRRYQANAFHHLMCGMAALATLLSTIAFASLARMRDVALEAIDDWETILRVPEPGGQASPEDVAIYQHWAADTLEEAYYRVRNSGAVVESEWATYPAPPTGREIPFGPTRQPNDQTPIRLSGQTYAEMAVNLFTDQHPTLNAVLWADTEFSEQDIVSDINQYLGQTRSGSEARVVYPLNRATQIAVDVIRTGLDEKAPRVVHVTRTVLAVLALLFQIVPFSVVGWAAYRHLKSHRRRP